MAWQLDIYIILLFCGAVVSAAVASAAWKRPVAAGGRNLAILMASVFIWSLSAAMEAAAVPQASKILLSKVEYVGIATAPLLLFLFALRYSRHSGWLTPGRHLYLWTIPFLTLGLALTNEWHGMIWTGYSWAKDTAIRLLIYHHGPFFWVHVAYSYSLLIVSIILILKAYSRSNEHQRRQARVLLAALPWPWLGNVLYLAGLSGSAGHDYTPLGFALAGLFLLWGMYRLELIDLIPVAREKVIESMGDSLIVVDEQGRIAAMNPSTHALLLEIGAPTGPASAAELIGSPAPALFSPWPELASQLLRPSAGQKDLVLKKGERTRFFSLSLSPLAGGAGSVTGWVAVLTDITRLKQAEASAVQARRIAETVQEAGMALSSTLDSNQMSAMVLQLIQRVIEFDAGAFLVAEGSELRLAGAHGIANQNDTIGRTFPITGCQLCNLVVQHQRPLITESILPEDIMLPLPANFAVRSYLGVPIVFQGHVTGLIALYARENSHFGSGDVRVAELFANQAAIALQNARLFNQMSTLAVTDNLTGLANRRGFFDVAEKEVERARRYGRSLCLVMFDIDDFKKVNDTHGHLIGDQVLRVLGTTARRTIRSTDTLCRFGGDEFLILMPESALDQALATAERLRQRISSEMVVVTAAGQLMLTISLGVVSLDGGAEETMEKLVERADAVMYQAKTTGKNRVCG